MKEFSNAGISAAIGGLVGLVVTGAAVALASSRGIDDAGLRVVAFGTGTLMVPILAAIGITAGVLRSGAGAHSPTEPNETGHERY